MHCSRTKFAAIVCLAVIPSCACFVRRRVVSPAGVKKQARPLLTATKEELIQRVHDISDPIQSFNVTADISPSVGNLYNGEVSDYATIRGYILFRKPDSIRIIGLDPVIHTKAVDMVSSGAEFRVFIPSKDRFIVGSNDAPATSKSKLENLRPIAFLTSLMIYPPDSNTETTLLEDDTNTSRALYILLIVRRNSGELRLVRNIYFDRYTLQIVRQKTFNPEGAILSDTSYSEWKTYGGVSFPSEIDIQRPQDSYEVTLSVIDMKVNKDDLTPDKFVLDQPPGSQLQRIQ
jgi:hypothetical protein